MIDLWDTENPETIVRQSVEELQATLREIPNRFRDIDMRESQAYTAIRNCQSERIHLQCMENLLNLMIYQHTN